MHVRYVVLCWELASFLVLLKVGFTFMQESTRIGGVHAASLNLSYKPYYDFVGNYVIIRACVMDSEMRYFHYALSTWCIMQYTVYILVYYISWFCVLSFLYNPYIPFLIYEAFISCSIPCLQGLYHEYMKQ